MTGKIIPIYKGTSGLNIKSDPARLPFDDKTGVRAMSRAVNVLVDDTGRGERSPGCTLKDAAVDIIWGDGYAPGLAIKNGNLCLLGESGGITAVQALTDTPKTLSAARFADMLFWTTGVEMGYIKNGQSFAWSRATYVPDYFQDQHFDGPLMGDILCAFAGRIFIASGRNLVYSVQWHPFLYRTGAYHLVFFDPITMVAPVADGLWVSDGNEIFWLDGLDGNKWVPISKGRFGVIPGQCALVNADDTPYEKISHTGYAVKAGTNKGIITLGANGFVGYDTARTLETEKDPYPLQAATGCGGVMGGHFLISYEP